MAGRQLAGSLFNDDPEYCRARNEESKSTDFGNLARSIAQGWEIRLPISTARRLRAEVIARPGIDLARNKL